MKKKNLFGQTAPPNIRGLFTPARAIGLIISLGALAGIIIAVRTISQSKCGEGFIFDYDINDCRRACGEGTRSETPVFTGATAFPDGCVGPRCNDGGTPPVNTICRADQFSRGECGGQENCNNCGIGTSIGVGVCVNSCPPGFSYRADLGVDGTCVPVCSTDTECPGYNDANPSEGERCINGICCAAPNVCTGIGDAAGSLIGGGCCSGACSPVDDSACNLDGGCTICCPAGNICRKEEGGTVITRCCAAGTTCDQQANGGSGDCVALCGKTESKDPRDSFLCEPKEACVYLENLPNTPEIIQETAALSPSRIFYRNASGEDCVNSSDPNCVGPHEAYFCFDPQEECNFDLPVTFPASINNQYPCYEVAGDPSQRGAGFCGPPEDSGFKDSTQAINCFQNHHNDEDCNASGGGNSCQWYNILDSLQDIGSVSATSTETRGVDRLNSVLRQVGQSQGFYCNPTQGSGGTVSTRPYVRAVGYADVGTGRTCNYQDCLLRAARPGLTNVQWGGAKTTSTPDNTGVCSTLEDCVAGEDAVVSARQVTTNGQETLFSPIGDNQFSSEGERLVEQSTGEGLPIYATAFPPCPPGVDNTPYEISPNFIRYDDITAEGRLIEQSSTEGFRNIERFGDDLTSTADVPAGCLAGDALCKERGDAIAAAANQRTQVSSLINDRSTLSDDLPVTSTEAAVVVALCDRYKDAGGGYVCTAGADGGVIRGEDEICSQKGNYRPELTDPAFPQLDLGGCECDCYGEYNDNTGTYRGLGTGGCPGTTPRPDFYPGSGCRGTDGRGISGYAPAELPPGEYLNFVLSSEPYTRPEIVAPSGQLFTSDSSQQNRWVGGQCQNSRFTTCGPEGSYFSTNEDAPDTEPLPILTPFGWEPYRNTNNTETITMEQLNDPDFQAKTFTYVAPGSGSLNSANPYLQGNTELCRQCIGDWPNERGGDRCQFTRHEKMKKDPDNPTGAKIPDPWTPDDGSTSNNTARWGSCQGRGRPCNSRNFIQGGPPSESTVALREASGIRDLEGKLGESTCDVQGGGQIANSAGTVGGGGLNDLRTGGARREKDLGPNYFPDGPNGLGGCVCDRGWMDSGDPEDPPCSMPDNRQDGGGGWFDHAIDIPAINISRGNPGGGPCNGPGTFTKASGDFLNDLDNSSFCGRLVICPISPQVRLVFVNCDGPGIFGGRTDDTCQSNPADGHDAISGTAHRSTGTGTAPGIHGRPADCYAIPADFSAPRGTPRAEDHREDYSRLKQWMLPWMCAESFNGPFNRHQADPVPVTTNGYRAGNDYFEKDDPPEYILSVLPDCVDFDFTAILGAIAGYLAATLIPGLGGLAIPGAIAGALAPDVAPNLLPEVDVDEECAAPYEYNIFLPGRGAGPLKRAIPVDPGPGVACGGGIGVVNPTEWRPCDGADPAEGGETDPAHGAERTVIVTAELGTLGERHTDLSKRPRDFGRLATFNADGTEVPLQAGRGGEGLALGQRPTTGQWRNPLCSASSPDSVDQLFGRGTCFKPDGKLANCLNDDCTGPIDWTDTSKSQDQDYRGGTKDRELLRGPMYRINNGDALEGGFRSDLGAVGGIGPIGMGGGGNCICLRANGQKDIRARIDVYTNMPDGSIIKEEASITAPSCTEGSGSTGNNGGALVVTGLQNFKAFDSNEDAGEAYGLLIGPASCDPSVTGTTNVCQEFRSATRPTTGYPAYGCPASGCQPVSASAST